MKFSHLALIPLCLAVSSCSAAEVLGPRPNKEILQLARQAEADASSLVDAPATAELRQLHAEQLYAEIIRVCGTDDSGQPPRSCRVGENTSPSKGATDAYTLAHNAAAAGAAAAQSVPAESVALVVAQAIDTAATQPLDFPKVNVTDDADVATARAMLDQEYAFDYALGLCAAYTLDDVDQRIIQLRKASSQRRAFLIDLIEPHGELPVSAPGYELGENTPTDESSAATLVEKLAEDMVLRWRATAATAESTAWAIAAITLAAQAQSA
ncbi:DUF4439 domain-containing protein [Corynebacterium mayonis]|uniref:DUF4439 domain-containing protein n=1 Tax=Corynebacterium mayonis TaxID=3062461 RepID=UPI00314071BB